MHLARCVASHVGSSHEVSQSKGDAGVGHVRGGCQLAPRRARAPQAPARSELGEMRTRRQPPKTRRRSRRGKPKVGDLAARIEKASGSRDSPRSVGATATHRPRFAGVDCRVDCPCTLLGHWSLDDGPEQLRTCMADVDCSMEWTTLLLRTALVQEVLRSCSSWCQHTCCC